MLKLKSADRVAKTGNEFSPPSSLKTPLGFHFMEYSVGILFEARLIVLFWFVVGMLLCMFVVCWFIQCDKKKSKKTFI